MKRDEYIISLTTDGALAQSGDTVSSRAQLEGILRAWAASGKPSLTLHFHGGLVNEAKGVAQAERLYAEWSENAQTYPVFVVWRSGALETLQISLLDIVQGSPLFRAVLQKLLKHVLRKFPLVGELLPDDLLALEMAAEAPALGDMARLVQVRRDLEAERLPMDEANLLLLDAPSPESVKEVTDADLADLQADLAADASARSALDTILRNAQRTPPPAAEMEPAPAQGAAPPSLHTGYLSSDLVHELEATGGTSTAPPEDVEAELVLSTAAWGFAGRILRAVINRFRAGSDHGLAGTVLEEMYRTMYADKLGRFIWDGIKNNAAGAYADNPAGATSEGDLRGMTVFIDLLRDHVQQHGKVALNLVGHSAGSIHICHFVERAQRVLGDDFALQHVALTAPACTVALFSGSLLPSLDRIGAVHIFDMQDDLERRDPVLPWLPLAYPHSLLYLVSGLLEGKADAPLLGLARHLRGKPTTDKDVLAVRALLDTDKSMRLVLSKTPEDAPAGAQAAFTSHYGERGPLSDSSTLNSIAAIIRPAPCVNLQTLEPTIPQEASALMQPSVSVMQGKEPAGVHSTNDLLGWELGGGPAGFAQPSHAEGDQSASHEEEGTLEAIIGENEIVDHRLVKGLLQAGRAVARIVVFGIEDFDSVPPQARAAAWEKAVAEKRLIHAFGTGWVFGRAKRLLITNNHVLPLPQAARTASAEFGYENDLHTAAVPQRVLALDPDAFFLTSPNLAFGGLDYTLVALNPAQQAACKDELVALEPVQGVTADKTKNIYLVQHPKGDPKAYVLNHNRKVNLNKQFITYISDTLRGSSGSPLFDDNLRLVGIHHLGNHTVTIGSRTEQTNLGSRIEMVLLDIVRQLRERNFSDEQVEYWFGEGVLLDMWKR